MLRERLVSIVEAILGSRLDYRAAYPAKVAMQHADGTLDLVPDSDRVPACTKVPIRYGVPGVSAKVAVGARALLEFAEGDPSKPIATVWESASVTELTVRGTKVRLGDGDRAVACNGDPVVVFVDVVTAGRIAALATTGAGPSVPVTGQILRGAGPVTAP